MLTIVALSMLGKSYRVDGIVIAVDSAAGTVLISHRPIEKYMPAMAMPFRVEDPMQAARLHPGMRISFELAVTRERSVIRNIVEAGGADALIPPPKERLRIGDAVPDVHLIDQRGKLVCLSDFRGKVLAVDFIYTRCPLPDVCPRLSASFASLQKRFRTQLGTDLVLLTITVDPDYDTPAVLAEYARRWSADYSGWRFLTGDVAKIAPQLGEIYWADEGSIGHNSTTSIIGRDGRLAATVENATWRVDQLQNLISHQLEKNP